jgi:hypothetical protein
MAKFTVGRIQFPSKQAFREQLSGIINKPPLGRLLDSSESEIVQEMVLNHENSKATIGAGIDHFKTGLNNYRKNCLIIKRTDGTEDTVSIDPKKYSKTDNSTAYFKAACRESIHDQIVAFRKTVTLENGQFLCAVTNREMEWKDGHVDHKYPQTFDMIVHQFVEEYGIVITQELTQPSDHDGREFVDASMRDNFREYHKNNADLRAIQAAANLSLGNRSN